MKLVYASRTRNVETLIERLGIDAIKIKTGSETVDGDYVLVTYTDGIGIIPPAVEKFIEGNKAGLKAAAVSGNRDKHPDSFCGAADRIAEKYCVPILARFHREGDDTVDAAIMAML